MPNQLTFDQIRPRMTLNQKLLIGIMLLAAVVVLITTYIWTDIDPLALYNKRQNAFSYLFGRQLSEMEIKEARAQAERMPMIVATEETYHELKQEMEARGQDFSTIELRREAREKAHEKLAAMNPEERQDMVDQEMERIVDEKQGGYFPPETAPAKLQTYFKALIETVAIAIWGSLLAIIAAIPVSMFAAQNTLALMVQGHGFRQRFLRWFSQFVVRRFLDFCRGFNEFVMALIFVAVIGLGPFAGVLALAIHTFGVLGKVFSEGIEAIEPGQVEAVSASGASPFQVMGLSVMPQVMPLIVSYSLLRFESNVRSATILGFVGAGGIGFLIFDKINGYLYREVCTMMIMVIVSVTIIDYICGILRRQFT